MQHDHKSWRSAPNLLVSARRYDQGNALSQQHTVCKYTLCYLQQWRRQLGPFCVQIHMVVIRDTNNESFSRLLCRLSSSKSVLKVPFSQLFYDLMTLMTSTKKNSSKFRVGSCEFMQRTKCFEVWFLQNKPRSKFLDLAQSGGTRHQHDIGESEELNWWVGCHLA